MNKTLKYPIDKLFRFTGGNKHPCPPVLKNGSLCFTVYLLHESEEFDYYVFFPEHNLKIAVQESEITPLTKEEVERFIKENE